MHYYSEQKARRCSMALCGLLRIKGLAKILIGILFLSLLHVPAQATTVPPPELYSLNLVWDASPSEGVVGYHLYYGTASGTYTNSIAIGNVTTVEVPWLLFGVTYYFAVTAVGANGLESDFSNEFSYIQNLPRAVMQTTGMTDGQFILTVTGPTGHIYDIEATEDFKTWTVIGTVAVGAGGSIDFTDTNAASFSKRFYRTRDLQP